MCSEAHPIWRMISTLKGGRLESRRRNILYLLNVNLLAVYDVDTSFE